MAPRPASEIEYRDKATQFEPVPRFWTGIRDPYQIKGFDNGIQFHACMTPGKPAVGNDLHGQFTRSERILA
jgi:hypothetical protein